MKLTQSLTVLAMALALAGCSGNSKPSTPSASPSTKTSASPSAVATVTDAAPSSSASAAAPSSSATNTPVPQKAQKGGRYEGATSDGATITANFDAQPPADLVAALNRISYVNYDVVTVEIDRRSDFSTDQQLGIMRIVGINEDGTEQKYLPLSEVLDQYRPSMQEDGSYLTRDGRKLAAEVGNSINDQFTEVYNKYLDGPGPKAKGTEYFVLIRDTDPEFNSRLSFTTVNAVRLDGAIELVR